MLPPSREGYRCHICDEWMYQENDYEKTGDGDKPLCQSCDHERLRTDSAMLDALLDPKGPFEVKRRVPQHLRKFDGDCYWVHTRVDIAAVLNPESPLVEAIAGEVEEGGNNE